MTTFTHEDYEMAAKAAGVAGAWSNVYRTGLLSFRVTWPADFVVNGKRWNPPEDDGDTLRLAVRLNIHIIPDRENEIVVADPWGYVSEFVEEMRDDEMKAARYAIFRAAIAIGRAMP